MTRVLAISGGVGGAKLCEGLAAELAPESLAVLVNTADDFRHLGLYISPDIDTLLYTLSGRASRSRGWGLSGETWQAMDALAELGGESWFRLGDRDLATHLLRTEALAAGASLTEVTDSLRRRMGIGPSILPMSDDPVATIVHSDEGELAFQDYFVRRQCEPAVSGFHFEGLAQAKANSLLLSLLRDEPPELIILCPSNPFVSVDPILKLGGIWELLRDAAAPVLAVSPIVAGMAIKGPAGKMMTELGMPVSAPAVLEHYRVNYPGMLSHFIIDQTDATLAADFDSEGISVHLDQILQRQECVNRHNL